MQIETERLLLRELTMEDTDALYAVLADSDIMRHYPYAFDENRVRNWIERNIQRYRTLGFGLWAVCRKDTGALIGDCGLTMQNIHGQFLPEIGYHIRGDQQRKGFAGEAARAVRDWAFLNTPFQMLYSYMKYTNLPSQKTAASYGCRYIEEYPDEANEITKVYGISRGEWEEGRREKSLFEGLLVKESLSDETVLELLAVQSCELWDTPNTPRYWTALSFTSDDPELPQRLSEALTGNWYVDFKSGDRKYIVFHNRVLSYAIGDRAAKDRVCAECRKLGIPEEQLDWAE